MWLDEIAPFGGWIVLMVFSLIPAVVIYKILDSAVQKNFATLKGAMGFAVELGGPVAFYVFLLLLGKNYIPLPAEITLRGAVEDVHGNSLKGYRIASILFDAPREDEEEFMIEVPRNNKDIYDLLIVKSGITLLRENLKVNGPNKIVVDSFPDEKVTKITGTDLMDQNGKPLPDGYIVGIEPVVRPASAQVQQGKVNFDIEHGMYMATFCPPQKEEGCHKEFLTDVERGSLRPLPKLINFSLRD